MLQDPVLCIVLAQSLANLKSLDGIITGEAAPFRGQPRIPVPVLRVKFSRYK